jgi:hypothetical protein
MPIRNRVKQVEEKNKSFKELFKYYKPLIDAKNESENQYIRNNNIFDDSKYTH